MLRILSLISSFLLSSAVAYSYHPMDSSTSSSTSLPVSQVFSIERGFDTTDMIEVAVQGYMPNSCYRLNKGTAYVDEVHKKILVNVEAYVAKNEICLPVITPFLEVIHLGPLSEGNYSVHSILDPDVTGSLHVEKTASEHQDNHLYAPVDTVELMDTPAGMASDPELKQTLSLKGTYPHMITGCMRVVDVKTYKTESNVLVVLPIAAIKDRGDCDPREVDQYNRFHIKREIPGAMEGKALIHVRTLNGRALNKLVDFTEVP